MAVLRIALLQLKPESLDEIANLQRAELACRTAKERGADIALFPEMWNIGYTFPFPEADRDPWRPDKEAERQAWRARAVDEQHPYVQHFFNLAAELEMAIAITYLERWPGAPRNTMLLIDRYGRPAHKYAKVHTCDFSMEALITPGEEFPVCELDTAAGKVAVGAMICYDREFPESARILMLNGAEIILVPNACDMNDVRLRQLSVRAFENMVGVAMANYVGPGWGRSAAYHPCVFTENGRVTDSTVVEADESEGVWIAEFDLDALRRYRERETWGNAYRKPSAYGRLVDTHVQPPFLRKDARR
ncbi:carbon-nitrogen hydrolase family protein [Alicyclobacillus shizuokensis]|uniref:carbon-nitrogen hydrolase family protein n=1 Tax=Alicyclobacillus shizuokensis TaxID=392014 RepID=UPI0008333A9F|nr:carbon-nitrogen hydrolase family protein [Alicyclobacillus shizuokensis]